ncbi:putative quinol monooxygenase [Halopenitus sp. H-Gu1]|uniref:putative quinol monooxygenase n=1 Tax=Halopenitus sp. H-Gu1 TaxID=3242697 RepID=UPI00359F45F7
MIVVHASFPIDPDRRTEAIAAARTLVEHTREEPGTITYHATTDLAAENTLRFIERYEDAAAFESHTETDHFQTFEAKLPELLADDPEIVRFEVEDATELEL